MPRVVLSCGVCGQRSLPARLSGGSSCNRNLRGEKSLWLEPSAAPCLPRGGGQPWMSGGQPGVGLQGPRSCSQGEGSPEGLQTSPTLPGSSSHPWAAQNSLKHGSSCAAACVLCQFAVQGCTSSIRLLFLQGALSPVTAKPAWLGATQRGPSRSSLLPSLDLPLLPPAPSPSSRRLFDTDAA